MFKMFFKHVANYVKEYAKKNGIIKTICSAIQGIVGSAGIIAFLMATGRRLVTKLKLKFQLRKIEKELKAEKARRKNTNDPNAYDENGYRLTSSEYHAKNMAELEMIEKYYTEDNLDCVKLIELNDPDRFKGMTKDQKVMYIADNDITFDDLIYEYGLDKDSQVRRHIAEEEDIPEEEVSNEMLQKFWDEAEADKVGIGSKVKAGYKRRKSKKRKAHDELCKPIDLVAYAAMEETYGVANYYTMNPAYIDPELAARRKKFDEVCEYACGFMNWMYVYNRPMFDKNLELAGGDTIQMWRILFIKYMEDEETFNQIKKELSGKLGILRSEANGHRRSTRPPITTLEEADAADRIETLLDEIHDIKMMAKCKVPPIADEELDDDEEESLYAFDDIKEFDEIESTIGEDVYGILDQLDALRASCNEPEVIEQDTESQNTEVNEAPIEDTTAESDESEDSAFVIRQPVKLARVEDDEEEPEDSVEDDLVQYISPKEYTTLERAKRLLDIYAKWYAEDPNAAMNNILSCLADAEHKNYKIFEVSDQMKEMRKADMEHNLPFKMIASDYSTKEERAYAAKKLEEAQNIYGVSNLTDMIKARTQYYIDYLEFTTVDHMIENLKNHPMPEEAKCDLVFTFITNGYEDCVTVVADVDEYVMKAKEINPFDRLKSVVLDDIDSSVEDDDEDDE